MSILNLQSVVTVLPVTDFDRATQWYTRLFGRDADVVPVEGVAEWSLTDTVWMQVAYDPDNAGNTNIVLTVTDLDAQIASTTNAGIIIGDIVEYPDLIRMVDLIDPDGNQISFVQELG